MTIRRFFAALAALVLMASPALPQERSTTAHGIFSLLPADSVTEHSLETSRRELPYTATAGTLDLHAQDGAVSAKVFYTAYVAEKGDGRRPIAFIFNGGPGAASAYLHLGLVGPKVLDFGTTGNKATTPALQDNPDSWLDFADLVFIDPVGTGWSRAASEDRERGFYGVKQDAETMAKVVTLYIQRNNRLASPKFLVGESYGGFRAAKVATALKDSQGMLVSGIVMLSPLIDSRLIFDATDYPLGAALQLPSLAAAELERRNAFTAKALAQAETFAMGDYLVSLAGPTPSGDAATAFYFRVAQLTGIPEADVARTRGFVGDIYAKSSQAAAGKIVSPYDASYAAPDPYPDASFDRGEDPVLDGFTRAYGPAFVAYAKSDLKFSSEMTYSLLNTEVNRKWEWGNDRGNSRENANATDDIRVLLSTIADFKLMVMHGYSDVLTPYGASRYVLDHLPPSLADGRTSLKVYRGGHMFYTNAGSRSQASHDARTFFAAGQSVD